MAIRGSSAFTVILLLAGAAVWSQLPAIGAGAILHPFRRSRHGGAAADV